MAKAVQLPDGSWFPLREGESPDDALEAARKKYPEAFALGTPAAPEAPKKGGIAGGLGLGLESLLSSYRTAAGAVTDPEEAARAALERQQALGQKYESAASLERVKKAYEEKGLLPAAKEVASQIPGAIAEQLPQLGAMFGGARLGAMAGAPLGPLGATIGGVGGAAATLLPQFFGSNIQRQAAEQAEKGAPIEVDRGSALASAAGQTALEAAGTAVVFGGRLVSQLTKIPEKALLLGKGNAQKLADERLRDLVLKGTAKGFAAELPVEIGQQMLERAQAGLSLTDTDALAEYGQTAYQVGLLSPLGIAGRASDRAGARQEVETQRAAEAQRLAKEQEAAATTPEALQTLYADYTQLSQQKAELDGAIDSLAKTPKPGKGADPEQRQAYAESQRQKKALEDQRNEFMAQYRPVEQEYDKRKDLIDQMLQAQQSALETAAPQEAQVAPVPTAEPALDVQKLMLEQDNLRNQLATLETQLESAPPEQFDDLNAQRQDLQKRIDARAALIEERGGSPLRQEEFEQATAAKVQAYNTKIEQLSATYTGALQARDYDKAQKAKDDLLKSQQELRAFTDKVAEQYKALQEKQAGLQERGQTRELFAEQPAQPETEEGIKYVSATEPTKPVELFATKPEEAAAATPTEPKQLEAVETAKTQVDAAEQALTEAAKAKDTDAIYKAVDALNQAEYGLDRARQDVGRPTLKSAVIDIFDPANLLRTAINDGDQKVINDLARQADRTALTQALNEKSTERERLINILEGRLDAEGVKRERADLFSQIYNNEQKSKFKNGTYADKELQALYDKGGPAAVESEWVAQQVEPLTRKVTTPQGNAKKSLYQQLVETAAEHADAVAALESGIATPTMGEKTAALQAKLGKGEAPAERMMDASERYNLRRRITTLENTYRMIEGKITPIRDQILQLHGSLYTTTKLEKPSKVAEQKRAEAEAEGRAPKAKSRLATTAARIAKGDVRKEAEASQKMRDLALELGQQESGYVKFEKEMTRRMTALENKYGDEDKAVKDFRRQVAKELPEKAMELGRKTPEYKATLKEQVAYFKEVLPTAGKQEVPTKRTGAVTRKQSAAPKRLVSSTPESKAASAREQEAFSRYRGSLRDMQEALDAEKAGPEDFDGDTVFRKRETQADGVVDAAQAQKVVDGLKLPSNVKFVYAPTAGEIPVKLLRQMAKEGVDPVDGMVQGAVFSDGTVLVVGDQHASVQDLEETIAHELVGHYGIDTVIGAERLNKFAQGTDVIKLAEQIGGRELVREVLSTVKANADLGRSEEVQKLQALREIIAHTEEARVTEAFRQKAGRWLKELVGMVRAGLRKMGFTKLPELSTSDVFYMLKQSRKAFASGKIGPYRAADGEIAFRRQRAKSDSVVAQEPTLADKFFGNALGLAGRVQLVDQYAALDKAVKEGMSAGQISALEATNANYLLRFGQQRSMFAGQFLTHGPVTLELSKKDGATTSTFRSIKGTTMLDVAEALNAAKLANPSEQENMFTVYLAGERARQVGWEKLNFKEPAKAKAEYDAVIARLNADQKAKDAFKNAKELYQKYNAGLLDFLVQTGVMTPQKAAELKAITYVPYYRVGRNGEVQLMIDKETPVRISNIKDEPQLQQLVGGNEAIMPVFTSAAQNTFMITNMGLRNQTVKETSFLLQKLGIASRVGEGAGPVGTSTIRFKKNGKDYHAIIDTDVYGIPADLIVKGMEGIKTTIPAVVRLMGYPADILRKFVTRMPAYAVRQIIRDPLNAWLTTGTDATPVISSMKELASMVAGRSEVERKLMTTGAVSSNVFSGDEQDMAKFLKDVSAGKSMWDKTVAKLDAFALQGDTATRAVIYKDSLDKGMSEQEALLRTLESMNFSRKGVSPSMQMLSILVPFFNAQVQGLDVVYRAFKGQMPFSEQLKIKEKLMARGALLALGTIAYAAMMEDDEAYKRAKPEERLASWFVYVPGISEPVRVPIPFELGFLFKALPEAVYSLATSDEKSGKVLSGLGKMLNQSNPFALPQAIKPLTEVVLGKSFYSGDIESAREKEMLPTQRYRENTTEVAKLLGQVTGEAGVSPISIDYLIRGYFGGLGIALVQLANPVLAVDQKEIAQPSTKPSKLPLIGGLFQPVEGRGTLDESYDRMMEIRQVKGTYNKLVEDGKLAEAKEFAQNYANDLAQMSVSGRVQKQLGELAKQERAIRASPTLSTEEKDKRLEQIDKVKTQLARQFLALPR